MSDCTPSCGAISGQGSVGNQTSWSVSNGWSGCALTHPSLPRILMCLPSISSHSHEKSSGWQYGMNKKKPKNSGYLHPDTEPCSGHKDCSKTSQTTRQSAYSEANRAYQMCSKKVQLTASSHGCLQLAESRSFHAISWNSLCQGKRPKCQFL